MVEVDTGRMRMHLHMRNANVRSTWQLGDQTKHGTSTPRAGDHRYRRALDEDEARPGQATGSNRDGELQTHGQYRLEAQASADWRVGWPAPWLAGWLSPRSCRRPLGPSSVVPTHYLPPAGLRGLSLGLVDIEQMGATFVLFASLDE